MKKILIVRADYYENISLGLENSALQVLKSNNYKKYDVFVVPGIFEIPVAISRNIKKYDGFIALGCVIKGETPHFDFISQATTNAIMKLSIDYKKPIGNGIITCLNKEQALDRTKKGEEAANAVIQVLSYKKLF
jgi:6,7-dimethyl-8-ribityllumazine synthase